MGMKKGPWTPEEDLILTNFIHHHGYTNWRALPQTGRCGKSCRLRWMNYLRPDIKRGNFTGEEEEIIMNLHQQLGNRWSVIASSLPGRTDNEIKNIWNTHLKKRLNIQSEFGPRHKPELETRIYQTRLPNADSNSESNSPMYSCSEVSSLANSTSGGGGPDIDMENAAEMDQSFWSEILSADDCGATSYFSAGNSVSLFEYSNSFCYDLNVDGGMEFWYNLFRSKDIIELPQF